MSRTKRSKDLNNKNSWNWKHKSVQHIKEGQKCLYWVDSWHTCTWDRYLNFNYVHANQEDLHDTLYKVRARHSSTSYPYYLQWKVIDSYDERCYYPAAYFDKHSYQ